MEKSIEMLKKHFHKSENAAPNFYFSFSLDKHISTVVPINDVVTPLAFKKRKEKKQIT